MSYQSFGKLCIIFFPQINSCVGCQGFSKRIFSDHDYLSGFMFDLANQSRLTEHFNRLTHFTNLQYISLWKKFILLHVGFIKNSEHLQYMCHAIPLVHICPDTCSRHVTPCSLFSYHSVVWQTFRNKNLLNIFFDKDLFVFYKELHGLVYICYVIM